MSWTQCYIIELLWRRRRLDTIHYRTTNIIEAWNVFTWKTHTGVNNEILIKEQPDYVILLAWHYAEPIMKQLKARGLKSNFIIPLPDLKIVKN